MERRILERGARRRRVTPQDQAKKGACPRARGEGESSSRRGRLVGEGNRGRRDKGDKAQRNAWQRTSRRKTCERAVSKRKKGKKDIKNAPDGCSVAPRVLEQKGVAS